jgi:hypothetical protein
VEAVRYHRRGDYMCPAERRVSSPSMSRVQPWLTRHDHQIRHFRGMIVVSGARNSFRAPPPMQDSFVTALDNNRLSQRILRHLISCPGSADNVPPQNCTPMPSSSCDMTRQQMLCARNCIGDAGKISNLQELDLA